MIGLGLALYDIHNERRTLRLTNYDINIKLRSRPSNKEEHTQIPNVSYEGTTKLANKDTHVGATITSSTGGITSVGIMGRYAVMENRYQQNTLSITLTSAYQVSLTDLCVSILHYFALSFENVPKYIV